jgi:negative regulator of flagellin synthesis FlgM
MTVNRISHLDPVPPGKKPGRIDQAGGGDKADTINLSTGAMEKAERYQVLELIKSAPELDEARIIELRKQIDDPAYLNEQVVNATADKLLSAWFA